MVGTFSLVSDYHLGNRGGTLGAKLDRLYWEISKKAPRAKVIVLGYPLLFDHPRRSARYCLMSQSADAAKDLNAAGRMLNRTIRDAARRHNFRFVGVARTFNGHGPCQDKGPRMWVNKIRVLGGHELHSMHPMKRGHRAEAMRVIRANGDLFR